jgi:hypothetical protein
MIISRHSSGLIDLPCRPYLEWEPVSPAREHESYLNILEQLVHSVRCEYCVSQESKGGARTPFIFVRYFIGMSGLVVGVSAFSQIMQRLFTVTSISGYAFITRDPLLLVRAER